MFGTDGLNYIPSEVAKNGYIKTQWEGDYRILNINEEYNGNIIDMLACFDLPAKYDITLHSTWQKGGEKGNTNTATVNLDIRSCPAIDKTNFDGEARAFQRQKFSFRLAQNPNYPIDLNSISVTIKDSKGNVVSYCKDLVIQTEASNEFVNVSLEFVTKNSDEEIFTYTVYAKDSRSKTLNVSKEFTVKKDQAPRASIKMPLRIYRDKTKIAIANPIYNGGKTDDPTRISWTLPADAIDPQYYDENQNVSFKLDKPGNYQISITVTDIWLDTIDEFTKDDIRKTSSYTLNFKVDNMAPSLEANSVQSLDLLLINNDNVDEKEISVALLEYNVSLNLYQVDIDKEEPKGELSYLGDISLTTRNDLDSTVYYESAHLLDDEYYYRLVTLSTAVSIPETLYIYRYDLSNLSEDPVSVQVPSTAFPNMVKKSVVILSTDLQEKNIYLRVDDETIAMNKNTKSFYPKFSKAIGKTAFALDDYVYSLCSDGFYSFSLSTGEASLINDYKSLNTLDCPSRLIFGKAYFCAEKDGAVYQCVFDLKTKAFSATKLFDSSGTNFLLSISPAGNMFFESIDSSVSTVRSYTRNCDKLYDPLAITRQAVFTGTNIGSRCCYPVFDRFGEVNYIYTAYSSTGKNYLYNMVMSLYHLKTQTKTNLSCGYTKPDMTRPVLGLQLYDGSVLAGLGTKYDNLNSKYSAAYKQLKPDGSTSNPTISFSKTAEFQCRSDNYIAISYTKAETSVISLYKFTEGFDAKAQRISLETLSDTSKYKYMTETLDINSIIESNHITRPGAAEVSIYRKAGDIVTLSDFGFSKDNYVDYEEDYPLREKATISFPFTCTKKGRYVFYFSVIDTTGTSFDKESKKQIGVIYVDSDEDDYDEPIEKPEQSSGLKNFILHRRY